MKKLILILGIVMFLFGINYTGKIIGEVNVKGGFFDGGKLKIFCINGVQYMGDLSNNYQSSLTPIYNKNGKIKTCK